MASPSSARVLGEYVRQPEENTWHRGRVMMVGGGLVWRNAAGAEWALRPSADGRRLECDQERCPYKGQHFALLLDRRGALRGFSFLGEEYLSSAWLASGGSTVVQKSGGLHGYISMELSVPVDSESESDSEAASASASSSSSSSSSSTSTSSRRRSSVVGSYAREPSENTYHVGRIEEVRDGALRWLNQAGVSWALLGSGGSDVLGLDASCPYFDEEAQARGEGGFRLVRGPGGSVTAFVFLGETYSRQLATAGAAVEGDTAGANNAGPVAAGGGDHHAATHGSFGHGLSFFSAVWALLPCDGLSGLQIGLPGTWLVPDNRRFTQALCPPGTCARDNWPERGPSYRDVFQTIEGGCGVWGSTRFATRTPKYRAVATYNGYSHLVGGAALFGWGGAHGDALGAGQLATLQLSNRVLMPPDGLTFSGEGEGPVSLEPWACVGTAWLNVPLFREVRAGAFAARPRGVGANTWTLFLSASNFQGPVVCFLPDAWAHLSQTYAVAARRGLDARQAVAGSVAMEVNTVPYVEAGGKVRVPQLAFPRAQRGASRLVTDVRAYSRSALYERLALAAAARDDEGSDSQAGWGAEGAFELSSRGVCRPKCSVARDTLGLTVLPGGPDAATLGLGGGAPRPVVAGEDRTSFELRWAPDWLEASEAERAALAAQPHGHAAQPGLVPLPSLFAKGARSASESSSLPRSTTASTWSTLRASDAPAALLEHEFRTTGSATSNDSESEEPEPYEAAVHVAAQRGEPCTARLNDCTVATYVWVRFVDQPAMALRQWADAEEKEALQRRVERLHDAWARRSADAPFLNPPSYGSLVAVDEGCLVQPPKGLERGYVPIVVRQARAATRQATAAARRARQATPPPPDADLAMSEEQMLQHAINLSLHET
jgi:hypothetical protein